jgi:nucleotide-binding universal stress UspA family protein
MLTHVLIPLDGSQLAEEAVESARHILPEGAKIILVTAINLPESWLYGADPMLVAAEYRQTVDQMEDAAKAYLQRIAGQLRAEGFQVEAFSEYGQAATVITDAAANRQVDAILMSTHGRSGISRWLFGSVTSKVLGLASCPVIVIPNRAKERVAPEAVFETHSG